MVMFAQDVLLVTLVHLRRLNMSGMYCILFLLVIIKEKGKMTMLVIRDLGITYYFQKIYILRVNNESSAWPANILFWRWKFERGVVIYLFLDVISIKCHSIWKYWFFFSVFSTHSFKFQLYFASLKWIEGNNIELFPSKNQT